MQKTKLVLWVTLIIMAFTLLHCKQEPVSKKAELQQPTIISGKTMGTYYRVTYSGEREEDLKAELDSILVAINQSMSTYIPTSLISQFNQDNKIAPDHFFEETMLMANQIYIATGGFFDPTVMPLVNYWGFGYEPNEAITGIDSLKIDSMLQHVGFHRLNIERTDQYGQLETTKKQAHVKVDFSAIAKGYAVDVLGEYLILKGIVNSYVDIGGEVRAWGEKPNNNPWVTAINIPLEDAAMTDIAAAIPLKDAAIATSGNYRNFYEVNGQKYSHTINPKTGYPERSNLLSASIYAANCATADAYATACMVAGFDKAFELINNKQALEGFFIYSNENGHLVTKATSGFPSVLELENK